MYAVTTRPFSMVREVHGGRGSVAFGLLRTNDGAGVLASAPPPPAPVPSPRPRNPFSSRNLQPPPSGGNEAFLMAGARFVCYFYSIASRVLETSKHKKYSRFAFFGYIHICRGMERGGGGCKMNKMRAEQYHLHSTVFKCGTSLQFEYTWYILMFLAGEDPSELAEINEKIGSVPIGSG